MATRYGLPGPGEWRCVCGSVQRVGLCCPACGAGTDWQAIEVRAGAVVSGGYSILGTDKLWRCPDCRLSDHTAHEPCRPPLLGQGENVYACPACGSTDLRIEATEVVILYIDGREGDITDSAADPAYGGADYDDDSGASCMDCDWLGTVGELGGGR